MVHEKWILPKQNTPSQESDRGARARERERRANMSTPQDQPGLPNVVQPTGGAASGNGVPPGDVPLVPPATDGSGRRPKDVVCNLTNAQKTHISVIERARMLMDDISYIDFKDCDSGSRKYYKQEVQLACRTKFGNP